MMHCKCIVTMVQCKHKRIIKLLILWLNVLATGEIKLTTGEKINFLSIFCSYKKLQTWTIFLDIISIFKTISRSGKSRLFQEFMTLYEPCSFYGTCIHTFSDF